MCESARSPAIIALKFTAITSPARRKIDLVKEQLETVGIVLSAPVQKASYMSQNLNTELLLLTSIFQSAHPVVHDVGGELNATEYLKFCASDIERIGRVFKFLGLAEESTQSVLRWKPTDRLIRMIGERSARPTKPSKKVLTEKDRRLVDMLLLVAGGDTKEDQMMDDFCISVLNALGFLREVQGGPKPTSLLKEIILDTVQ